jgi:hypothetical protein
MIYNTLFKILLAFLFAITFLSLIAINQIGQALICVGYAVWAYFSYKNPLEERKR